MAGVDPAARERLGGRNPPPPPDATEGHNPPSHKATEGHSRTYEGSHPSTCLQKIRELIPDFLLSRGGRNRTFVTGFGDPRSTAELHP
jgi:hypothetical protein